MAQLRARSGAWVRVGGTVGGRDAAAERTWTYSQRVPTARSHAPMAG